MPFLRNVWYMAGWADELREDDALVRTIVGQPLLLLPDGRGGVSALLDRCPHRFAPLSKGKVADGIVTCGYHGIAFNAEGRCVANPHGPIVSALQVPRLPAVIAHDAIWIWPGDPEAADPSLVPDLSFIPPTLETAQVHGYESIRANYELCADNILDLSHSDFLHPDSLGGGATTRAKTRVVESDASITVIWLAENDTLPPAMAPTIPSADGRGDLHISVEWMPPGVMILRSSVTLAGQPAETGAQTLNVHIMMPGDETNTHYFYWNSRNFLQEDEALNEITRTVLKKAFGGEDKPMLEAQQQRIGNQTFDALKPVLLRTDDGAVRVRRRMRRLMEEERRSQAAA